MASDVEQLFKSISGSDKFPDLLNPGEYLLLGAVDLLIFPLFVTGLTFILGCSAWVFGFMTVALFKRMTECKCADCGILSLPFLALTVGFGAVTLALALGVLACFLVRGIASTALFLIALPFVFACGRSDRNYGSDYTYSLPASTYNSSHQTNYRHSSDNYSRPALPPYSKSSSGHSHYPYPQITSIYGSPQQTNYPHGGGNYSRPALPAPPYSKCNTA